MTVRRSDAELQRKSTGKPRFQGSIGWTPRRRVRGGATRGSDAWWPTVSAKGLPPDDPFEPALRRRANGRLSVCGVDDGGGRLHDAGVRRGVEALQRGLCLPDRRRRSVRLRRYLRTLP